MSRKPEILLAVAAIMAGAQSVPLRAEPPDAVVSAVVAHAKADPAGRAAFTFDAAGYAGDARSLPIGVFDSGIGGLTVLEALLTLDAFHNDTLQPGPDGRRDFENERFVYLGDQANMPYGLYPRSGRTDYLRELILKDTVFLLGRRAWSGATAAAPHYDKPPVKAVVIACNTATAYGLEDIRAALKAWNLPVPVIGVVDAGARGVNEVTSDGTGGAVAVLATAGTCESGAYPKAIGQALGRAGKPPAVVVQQPCASLAGAIEGDPAYARPVADYIREDVRALLATYRSTGDPKTPLRTVVLGCTHFPLVSQQIEAAFAALREEKTGDDTPFRNLIAERLDLVNPAELTAKELFRALASARLRLNAGEVSALPEDAFYLSVAHPASPGIQLTAEGALTPAYKYGRLPGSLDVEDTRVVSMAARALPAPSLNLIRSQLPEVSRRLR